MKDRNVIAHFGTGLGKTFIAMLSAKHFLELHNSKVGQVLIIVPTITLTQQHCRSFETNSLTSAYSAKAVSAFGSNASTSALNSILDAHIIIATHGAILDLYRHYKDIFNIKQISLLVLDECHHAGSSNHGYSQFMQEIYWKVDDKDRPRVLGLTASPCFNFDVKNLDEQIGKFINSIFYHISC